jgi:hypothetical protein
VDLTPGSRWQSTVCGTQVIVVRPPSEGIDLRCGGQPMVPLGAEVPAGLTLSPDRAGGTPLGKRYVHEASGLEVLCTQGGDGTLAAGAEPLVRKEAKPLPSSD